MVAALLSFAALSNPIWVVHLDQPLVHVSPTLYGIFFEEINCAGDGGLYAQLVRNWSFEDAAEPKHWMLSGSGTMTIAERRDASEHDRQELIVHSSGPCSLRNEGFFGMGLNKGQPYAFSADVQIDRPFTVELQDPSGKVLAQSERLSSGTAKASLVPNATSPNASLVFKMDGNGDARIDHVSLFPTESWKGHQSVLRKDLAELLGGLRPAFMRFPGGCWVEGDTMSQAMRWKATIGPVATRRTQPNLWGYQSTNGLGFHEYLQLCEDLGAEPLFVINCGMSHKENVPMDKMDEFVQDALDAIEYANGPATSTWGAIRARHGHPEPFGLKYLEIGNENGGPAYEERYGLMYRAIKAKYPDVNLICNLWGGLPKKTPIDIIDEHYYSDPSFFIQNADRYDTYDRKGPKIYVGEYAVTQGCGNGNLRGALAEAVFMMGMERNSDIVTMASYAPLFARVEAKAWNPDLIYFDSLDSWGTPSYHVQAMFSKSRPDVCVKSELKGDTARITPFPAGAVGIGTWNTVAEFKEIKVVQGGKVLFESENGEGGKVESGEWEQAKEFVRQKSGATPARMVFGDPKWAAYTLTLKAKRVSGAEGFLITVGHHDSENYLWFNVGGWGNRENALELARNGAKISLGKHKEYQTETGKWVDIRIDYSAERVRCFLDGVEVYDEHAPQERLLHVLAGLSKSGSPILKIVNLSDKATTVTVDLRGGQARHCRAEVLTHSDDRAENTKDQPRNVVPQSRDLGKVASPFDYSAPPHSLSVLTLD